MIELGCLIQIDALSVTGGYTQEIEIFTRALLERGQAHFIATRAGRQSRRAARLSDAMTRAGQIIGREAARYLVNENPLSVIENATIAASSFAAGSWRGFAAALQSRS
jgi:protein-tyrosine phosphatase